MQKFIKIITDISNSMPTVYVIGTTTMFISIIIAGGIIKGFFVLGFWMFVSMTLYFIVNPAR